MSTVAELALPLVTLVHTPALPSLPTWVLGVR
jgi:hypothetical protein